MGLPKVSMTMKRFARVEIQWVPNEVTTWDHLGPGSRADHVSLLGVALLEPHSCDKWDNPACGLLWDTYG